MTEYCSPKRTRNVYDPASDKPFSLSRSRLDLFLECPRCFHLDRRRERAGPVRAKARFTSSAPALTSPAAPEVSPVSSHVPGVDCAIPSCLSRASPPRRHLKEACGIDNCACGLCQAGVPCAGHLPAPEEG